MSDFLSDAMTAAIRREVVTDIEPTDDLGYCLTCRWLFFHTPDDLGICGTCAREAGLAPRDALTDELDKRVRDYQRCMAAR